jgi:hypothetical protein
MVAAYGCTHKDGKCNACELGIGIDLEAVAIPKVKTDHFDGLTSFEKLQDGFREVGVDVCLEAV